MSQTEDFFTNQTTPESRQSRDYSQKMIEAFIDKPSETFWYQNSFSRFNINGVDTMKWNWSLWALGGGFLYLLYRKQYIPALVVVIASFTIGMIFPLGLIIAILVGGYAPYFVYKGYKNKLEEIESKIDDEEIRIQTMREVGGYNQWVVWVYGLFIALISLYVITIVSALIAIP